jgi:hypothetical protein
LFQQGGCRKTTKRYEQASDALRATKATVPEELIDQRDFAVVDMGDGSWSPVRMARQRDSSNAYGSDAGGLCRTDAFAFLIQHFQPDWRFARRAPALMGFASLNPSYAATQQPRHDPVGWVERSETHQPHDIPVSQKLL